MKDTIQAADIMHVMDSFDAAETVLSAFSRKPPSDHTSAARGCLFAAGAILAKAGFDVDDDMIVRAVRGVQNKAVAQLTGKAQHNHPVALHVVGGTDYADDELDRHLLDRDFDEDGNDRGPLSA